MNKKYLWLSIFGAVFVWSAIDPNDGVIWALETLPALVALVILVATYRSFSLTPMLYWLILAHCVILMIGGHYTYAEVPLFDDISTWIGWERNNYDKVGHFAQGFVPALVTREIIIRNQVVNGRGWTAFFVVCVCLAISAFYELIEWWVALISQEAADAFLGTQGYVWDTQSDMGFALLGASSALLFLSRAHDRQLARLSQTA